MIEKLKIQDFHKVYDLIEMSFSSDEYRTYDEQKALTDGRKNLVYTTNWILRITRNISPTSGALELYKHKKYRKL